MLRSESEDSPELFHSRISEYQSDSQKEYPDIYWHRPASLESPGQRERGEPEGETDQTLPASRPSPVVVAVPDSLQTKQLSILLHFNLIILHRWALMINDYTQFIIAPSRGKCPEFRTASCRESSLSSASLSRSGEINSGE